MENAGSCLIKCTRWPTLKLYSFMMYVCMHVWLFMNGCKLFSFLRFKFVRKNIHKGKVLRRVFNFFLNDVFVCSFLTSGVPGSTILMPWL